MIIGWGGECKINLFLLEFRYLSPKSLNYFYVKIIFSSNLANKNLKKKPTYLFKVKNIFLNVFLRLTIYLNYQLIIGYFYYSETPKTPEYVQTIFQQSIVHLMFL